MPMRVTHWINLICMACLIFSGFLIHFPFWAALTGVARGAHVFLGIVLLVNCIVRIVFAFLLQTAPTGGTRNLVRDYKPGFLRQTIVTSWVLGSSTTCSSRRIILKRKAWRSSKDFLLGSCFLDSHYAYTGFCLWVPTASWTFFAAGTSLVGGMMSMRIIHYFMMFVFIIFSMLHIYLVFIEGTAPAKLMLLGKEHGGKVYDPNRHVIVGEDHSVDAH